MVIGKIRLFDKIEHDLEFTVDTKKNLDTNKNLIFKFVLGMIRSSNLKIPKEFEIKNGEIVITLSDEILSILNSDFSKKFEANFGKNGKLESIKVDDLIERSELWEIGNVKKTDYYFFEPISEKNVKLTYSEEENVFGMKSFVFSYEDYLPIGRIVVSKIKEIPFDIKEEIKINLYVEKVTGIPVYFDIRSIPSSNFLPFDKILEFKVYPREGFGDYPEFIESVRAIRKTFLLLEKINIIFLVTGMTMLLFIVLFRNSNSNKTSSLGQLKVAKINL